MIILLSPSKSLDYSETKIKDSTLPLFQEEALEIVNVLQKKSNSALKKLMKVSDKIAKENNQRYKDFSPKYTEDNSKQAILAFKGDVYTGMNNDTMSKADLKFAQKHVRILSGLYGILKPLDLMQPYRLEMGTKLPIKKTKNLYVYWDTKLTDHINEEKPKLIVNLASKEYYRSIKEDQLDAKVLNINFKEFHNGELKFLSFNAKKARGMLTRYIIDNRIKTINKIKGFDTDRYYLDTDNSTEMNLQFVRKFIPV